MTNTLAGVDMVRRFGSSTAVAGVDIAVDRGEIVGLLGANGAGKTTAIRLLLGLLAPTSGSVRHFGTVPTRATRSRIGYVPQQLGLWAALTAEENLRFVESAYGALPEVELAGQLAGELPRGPVGVLSLGERRRLAFAAALGHRPDVLVLDEPTSGVGPLARTRLWDDIRSAADAGAGVLVTTHYMDEASNCDRVIVMKDGRVVAAGTLDSIIGGSTALEVSSADWTPVFAALVDASLAVSLVGTSVRVVGADPGDVEGVLARAGVSGRVAAVPATFDEVFVALSRATGSH